MFPKDWLHGYFHTLNWLREVAQRSSSDMRCEESHTAPEVDTGLQNSCERTKIKLKYLHLYLRFRSLLTSILLTLMILDSVGNLAIHIPLASLV